MDDAIERVSDVQRTLSYGIRRSLSWHWLAGGLFLLGYGVVVVYVRPSDFTLGDRAMTVFAIVVGAITCIYALVWLLRSAKPLVVLSPRGIRMRIEWVKVFLIPWHEVRGVETIDVTARFGRDVRSIHGVTVVLVSETFYDRYIYVGSPILRGPGWDASFVPKGNLVQVVLNHALLDASAAELRLGVELRWRAFGGESKPKGALAKGAADRSSVRS